MKKLYYEYPTEEQFNELVQLYKMRKRVYSEEVTVDVEVVRRNKKGNMEYCPVLSLFLYIYFYTGTKDIVQQLQFILALTSANVQIMFKLYPEFKDIVHQLAPLSQIISQKAEITA